MCKYCSAQKISEAAAALTKLNSKAARAKMSITFPINIVLQQAIIDDDKEEIKKTIKRHTFSLCTL